MPSNPPLAAVCRATTSLAAAPGCPLAMRRCDSQSAQAHTHTGHTKSITSVTFSPDGHQVASTDITSAAKPKIGKLDIPDTLNTVATYPIAPISTSKNATWRRPLSPLCFHQRVSRLWPDKVSSRRLEIPVRPMVYLSQMLYTFSRSGAFFEIKNLPRYLSTTKLIE